jgi:hypothetical protein
MMDNKVRSAVVSSLQVNMRIAIVCSTLLLACGVAATASSLLQDPQILIDSGGDATGISIPPGINIAQPCGMATCSYDFVNDTPNIVTGFNFKTTINTGLTSEEASLFTCADPGGYFISCNTKYDSLTGTLQYFYSGVNPPDADENGTDTEAGEQEGIPLQGHFIITLQGWTENDVLFVDGTPPSLINTFSTDAPEPSVAITLGSGLLLLAAMLRRRRTV